MVQHQLCRSPRENRKDDEGRKRAHSLGEIGAARVNRIGTAVFRKEDADNKPACQKNNHPNRQRNTKICPRFSFPGGGLFHITCHKGLSRPSSAFPKSSEPACYGIEIVTHEWSGWSGADALFPARAFCYLARVPPI